MQSCKSGKRFVGITADGNKHNTLVPGRQKGTFTASVTDNVSGKVYSILLDGNGTMMVVKRAWTGDLLEPIRPLDNTWAPKLMALLETSEMGYGQLNDGGVSAGYDQTNRFINDHILCLPPHCLSITQEFHWYWRTRDIIIVSNNVGILSTEMDVAWWYGHIECSCELLEAVKNNTRRYCMQIKILSIIFHSIHRDDLGAWSLITQQYVEQVPYIHTWYVSV